jgi:hypothetical protein
MNNSTVLHIGGPLDGYRRPVPPSVSGFFRAAYYNSDSSFPDAPNYMTAGYRVMTIPTVGKQITLAVCDTVKDPFEALVKGYHGHRNPKRKYKMNSWQGSQCV